MATEITLNSGQNLTKKLNKGEVYLVHNCQFAQNVSNGKYTTVYYSTQEFSDTNTGFPLKKDEYTSENQGVDAYIRTFNDNAIVQLRGGE